MYVGAQSAAYHLGCILSEKPLKGRPVLVYLRIAHSTHVYTKAPLKETVI